MDSEHSSAPPEESVLHVEVAKKVDFPQALAERIRKVLDFDPQSGLAAIKHLRDYDISKVKDVLVDKLDDFIWTNVGRQLAKGEFTRAGFIDPDRAVKVVGFLRQNCETEVFASHGDGGDYIARKYEYTSKDLNLIRKMSESSDVDLTLLHRLGDQLSRGDRKVNEFQLESIASYLELAKRYPQIDDQLSRLIDTDKYYPDLYNRLISVGQSLADTTQVDLVMSIINEFPEAKKLSELFVYPSEVANPVMALSQLPTEELVRLSRLENISRVKNLFSGGSEVSYSLNMESIPEILKITDDSLLSEVVPLLIQADKIQNAQDRELKSAILAVNNICERIPVLRRMHADGINIASFMSDTYRSGLREGQYSNDILSSGYFETALVAETCADFLGLKDRDRKDFFEKNFKDLSYSLKSSGFVEQKISDGKSTAQWQEWNAVNNWSKGYINSPFGRHHELGLILITSGKRSIDEYLGSGSLTDTFRSDFSEFLGLISKTQPEYFLRNVDLEDDVLINSQRSKIIEGFLIGLSEVKIDLKGERFNDIFPVLSNELKRNGQFDDLIKQAFYAAYKFPLTEGFVRQNEEFRETSLDKRYDALIPDRKKYWSENARLLLPITETGWTLSNFDRFRSLVQNPETNYVLKTVSVDVLKQLVSGIGLKQENLFYTNAASIGWLAENLDDSELYGKFFRKILNEKPTMLNGSVDVIRGMSSEDAVKILSKPIYEERLVSSMTEFKNITPSLIKYYVLEDDKDKREKFKDAVIKFRQIVNQNYPIKTLGEGYDENFLAEMICLSFPGTTLDIVKAELANIEDYCDHLKNLILRKEGYYGQINSREKVALLRDETKPIDERTINLIKVIFASESNVQNVTDADDIKRSVTLWARLLNEAGATKQQELFEQYLPETISCIRASMGDKISVFTESMFGDTSQVEAQNNLLSKARELFGIYYKDNAPQAIENVLRENTSSVTELSRLLTPDKIKMLNRNILGGQMSEETKEEFADIITGVERDSKDVTQLSRLLAFMTERSIFAGSRGLRKSVASELGRIIMKDKEGLEIDPSVIIQGHVTKNAASYFAKTSAGICTAHDIELFKRPDHFHVNLTNNSGMVVGNIQGYITRQNGQPALIFRGFNPSTSLITSSNSDVLCDQMVDIVKQVATDNNITQVFIPEQDDWHRLTNRIGQGVDQYFAEKFYKPENQVSLRFAIRGNTAEVSKYYRI